MPGLSLIIDPVVAVHGTGGRLPPGSQWADRDGILETVGVLQPL